MIEQIPTKFLGQETTCVQMFMCKLEPAFWSMQTTSKSYHGFSLRHSFTSNLNKYLDTIYLDLPDLRSLREFGKRCDDLYPSCELISGF